MKHKITNHNIIHPNVEKNIKENFPNGLDFCYTDPPWGTGNLKYWTTLLTKHNGLQEHTINQDELENRFVKLITENVNNYAFIVYGKHQGDSCVAKFKQMPNVKDVQVYVKKYRSGSHWIDNIVICVTLNNAEIVDWSIMQTLKGLSGLKYICERFKGKYTTCLELFIGVGYYLSMLNKNKYIVCGNEMNITRLQRALAKVKD